MAVEQHLVEATSSTAADPTTSPKHERALSASGGSLASPRSLKSPTPSDISFVSATEGGSGEVPENFLTSCHGNKKKAKAKWEAHKKWRVEHKIGK